MSATRASPARKMPRRTRVDRAHQLRRAGLRDRLARRDRSASWRGTGCTASSRRSGRPGPRPRGARRGSIGRLVWIVADAGRDALRGLAREVVRADVDRDERDELAVRVEKRDGLVELRAIVVGADAALDHRRGRLAGTAELLQRQLGIPRAGGLEELFRVAVGRSGTGRPGSRSAGRPPRANRPPTGSRAWPCRRSSRRRRPPGRPIRGRERTPRAVRLACASSGFTFAPGAGPSRPIVSPGRWGDASQGGGLQNCRPPDSPVTNPRCRASAPFCVPVSSCGDP